MPNIKSAKKRVKTSLKSKISNTDFMSSVKTSIKKVEKLIHEDKKEEALNLLQEANKKLDKACAKGLIKKNNRDRNKSKLTKKVQNMK